MLAENIFLLKTSFLGKFELFFSILNVNPTLVTMTAPKHLLNATEVTTCRNGVETSTYHVKMLNGLISNSGQIFKHIFYFS